MSTSASSAVRRLAPEERGWIATPAQERQWYVCYTTLGKRVAAGPYEAKTVYGYLDAVKAGGYATNAFVASRVPDDYELLRRAEKLRDL